MVQNAKMKNIGKMLLSWAAVIVLVVAVVIFICSKLSEHSSCDVCCYDFCSCCNSIYGSGRI